MDIKDSNNLLILLIRTVRVRQWLKNLALFAALLFGGYFFDKEALLKVTEAFFVYCGVSSGVYIINDIIDAPRDRAHPFKRLRPIASGKLAPQVALVSALLILSLSLFLAFKIGHYFFGTAVVYIILQLFYSFSLRNIIIIDALTVAAGFILRVIAGSVAVSISISSWLILATIGISMLLAFGKRRSEKTLLAAKSIFEKVKNGETRVTLAHYPDNLLDSMISMSASIVIITYSLFTFQISSRFSSRFLSNILPPTLAQPKWMMITIPFVIYGVARYLYVIYEKKGGESPERVLLSDKPLLFAVTTWFILVLAIIYGGVTDFYQ